MDTGDKLKNSQENNPKRLAFVDLFPMSYTDHQNNEGVVFDSTDETVISDPIPP